jgi:Radical SAM superfamily
MNRFQIPALEVHASHACNIRCQGCTHYANLGAKGIVSVEEVQSWMRPWSSIVKPKIVGILGGEPMLNPRLGEFVEAVADIWRDSQIILMSNGLLLDRHENLPEILERRRIILDISIHHDGPRYREKIEQVKRHLARWKSYHPNLMIRWLNSYRAWRLPYQECGEQIVPYDEKNPEESYRVCLEHGAFQLFEGNIWKCPGITYLQLPEIRSQLTSEWKPYLDYQPAEPTWSKERLAEFFDAEAESCCRMCPTKRDHIQLNDPLK